MDELKKLVLELGGTPEGLEIKGAESVATEAELTLYSVEIEKVNAIREKMREGAIERRNTAGNLLGCELAPHEWSIYRHTGEWAISGMVIRDRNPVLVQGKSLYQKVKLFLSRVMEKS